MQTFTLRFHATRRDSIDRNVMTSHLFSFIGVSLKISLQENVTCVACQAINSLILSVVNYASGDEEKASLSDA